MILEFVDIEGNKHTCVTEFKIKDRIFYITGDKKIYTKSENGRFEPYTEVNEESNILSYYLKEPESLDVILPKEELEK